MKTDLCRCIRALLAGVATAGTAWGYTYLKNDSTGMPYKWPAGTVAIQIKLGSSPTLIDGSNFNTSAKAAADFWNTKLGDLQITSTLAAAGSAGEQTRNRQTPVNELVFDSTVFGTAFDSSTLAVTTTWVRGNQRVEADIIFNSARTWDSYRGARISGTVDLQRVALHEMGHLLGLDHPNEAGQSVTAIMNSAISGLDTLADDDITGAQNLYGPPGTPANDSFANATPIILTNNAATLAGYTTNATKQTGEPNHAGNAGGHSVWWRWGAPAAGAVTFDTRGSYSDTTLAVYTGSAVSSLTAVSSNDDINPGVVQASSLTFNAVAGTTYFVAVDGFRGDDGLTDSSGITLNVSHSPTGPVVPVITAQPVGATVTAGGSASFSVTATGATGYQWFFNGSSISGATGATYTISNAQSANAGSYFVTVTNSAGSVNSDTVTLTVNTPAPPVTPPSSGGGGGGGGGAPSLWFYGALSLLGLARFLRRHR